MKHFYMHIASRKNKDLCLPQINLKYFSPVDSDGKRITHPELTCSRCGVRDIVVGSYNNNDPKHIVIICEECAISAFWKNEDIKDRETARLRRRRLFDVIYLFTELCIDQYLKNHHLSCFEKLDEEQLNLIRGIADLNYNDLTKRMKRSLEETGDQKEIEQVLSHLVNNCMEEIEEVECEKCTHQDQYQGR
jgi:hypothetical protein